MASCSSNSYQTGAPSSVKLWESPNLSVNFSSAGSGSTTLTFNATLQFYDEGDVSDPYTYKVVVYSGDSSSNLTSRGQFTMTKTAGTTTDATWYVSNSIASIIPTNKNQYYRFNIVTTTGYSVMEAGATAWLYWTSSTPSTSPTSVKVNNSSSISVTPGQSFTVSWSGGTKGTDWTSWHVHVSCTTSGGGGPWDYWKTVESMTDDFGDTRVGYTYKYQVEAIDNSTTAIGYGSAYATVTVVAQTYTATVTSNNTNYGTVSGGGSYASGASVPLVATAKTGYHFVQWTFGGGWSGTSTSASLNKTMASAAVTATATFAPDTYTISYNANGGSSTPSSQTKTYGVALTLASAISKNSTTSTVTSTYTTTFNATANGGASNSTKENTKKVTTTQPYSFNKWAEGSASGSTTYSAGGSYTANKATTLYATWTNGTATTTTTTTSITFPAIPSHATTTATASRTVYYNANGGSGTTTAQSVSPTATVTWTANKWWTTQSSGGTSYSAGATITPTASSTYYARYTASTGNYSSPTIALRAALTKASTSTTTTTTITTSFSAASAVNAITSTKTVVTTQPYSFNKWAQGSASGSTTYAAGATYTPTAASITFYATWTNGTATSATTYSKITLPNVPAKANTTSTITRTVNYNANGGTGTTTAQSVSPTATVTWSDDDKWYTASSGGTGYAQGLTTYQPTASATLYAHYTASTDTYSSPTIALRSALTFAAVTTTTTTTVTLNFSAASAVSSKTTTKTVVSTQAKTFDKWRLNSTTGTSYSAGATFTPTATSATFYATSKNNGSATNVTTYGSVTLPNVPAKANTTATKTNSITFNINGGSSGSNTTLTNSGTATVTWGDDDKWYTASSGGTGTAQGSNYTLTADNGTLYAHYTDTTGTYGNWTSITTPAAPGTKTNTTANGTISYNVSNGGTASTTSATYTVTTKYKFGGWTTNSSGTSGVAAGSAITPTASTTYYAAWPVSTTTYASTTLATVTPPTGKVATGWYSAASGGTKLGNPGASYTPTSAATTVYIQYTAQTYTVAYNANGGTGAPSSQTKTYGVDLTLSSTKPTRTGFYFAGWNTSSSAITSQYSAGGTYTANTGATLYAVWWKCAYIYDGSAWKAAIPYICTGGTTWKRAEPYVCTGGTTWK